MKKVSWHVLQTLKHENFSAASSNSHLGNVVTRLDVADLHSCALNEVASSISVALPDVLNDHNMSRIKSIAIQPPFDRK